MPGSSAARDGLALARSHNCTKAIPLLEQAERERHRPSTAVPLADCLAATGKLLRAGDLYQTVVTDEPTPRWTWADHQAVKAARTRADELMARIPRLRIELAAPYEGREIWIDGRVLSDASAETPVEPAVPVSILVRAHGHEPFTETVLLQEKERWVVKVRLVPIPPLPLRPPPPASANRSPTRWLGVRYYGAVLPQFMMNAVVDGGRTLAMPGVAATFTTPAGRADLTFALGYLSLRMGDTPTKPRGSPNTDWEIVDSTLQGLMASVDLTWAFPLDASHHWSVRVGGGVGVGWTFAGDLHRTQAYPQDGLVGDPAAYLKCRGPNNPWGTFRYCNTLDKDATHYGGFAEPDWFHHGIRPLVSPWLVLPQLGLSWKPARAIAFDLDTGLSLAGFLTSFGVRVAL